MAGTCGRSACVQAAPVLLLAGGLRALCRPLLLLLMTGALAPFCQLRCWGTACSAARDAGCVSASGVRSSVADSRWAMASLAALSSAAESLFKCTASAKRAWRRPPLSVMLMASSKRLERLATGTLVSAGKGMRAAAAAAWAAGESFAGVRGVSDGSGMRAAAAAAAVARVALPDPNPDDGPAVASRLLLLLPRLRRVGSAFATAGDAAACRPERSDGCCLGVGDAVGPGPLDMEAAVPPPPPPPELRSG
jgi:hypothetical protein